MLALRFLLVVIVTLILARVSGAQVGSDTSWQAVDTADGSRATPRHEASAVTVDGKLYLLGGRGNRPVEVYDPQTRRWRVVANAPLELHHFQPVAVGQKIYALAAFTCCYPNEVSIADIHVFDTVSESWSTMGTMPSDRVRGAAAAAVHDGKIYVIGGNTQGHNGGAVNWFDRFDPVTGVWETLPDAPHARDHFTVSIANGKLVAAGGRTTELPNPFANPVRPTNVYDFSTGNWSSAANIPTARAGTVSTSAGEEVLVAGGEINGQSAAYKTTEAFNVNTGLWRTLQSMISGRHSGGAAMIGSTWHVVAGSNVAGGGGEFSGHETLELNVLIDQDNDGLSDLLETSVHNTDPLLPDTDNDGLIDGREVELGSNPTIADTDGDLLTDGDEVTVHNSDPLLKDTDADGLEDYAEVVTWMSDVRKPDTDDDNLNDSDEVERGTSPTSADTDNDGLQDGAEIIAGSNPLVMDTDNDGLIDSVDPDPLTPLIMEPEQPSVDPPVDPPVDLPVDNQPADMSGGGTLFWLIALLGVVRLSRMAPQAVKLSSN